MLRLLGPGALIDEIYSAPALVVDRPSRTATARALREAVEAYEAEHGVITDEELAAREHGPGERRWSCAVEVAVVRREAHLGQRSADHAGTSRPRHRLDGQLG